MSERVSVRRASNAPYGKQDGRRNSSVVYGNAAPPSQAEQLVEAARQGDEIGLSALLELGASPNSSASSTTPLIAAAENGHAGCVRALLAAKADANLATASGHTPLRAAILGGDGECIEALLQGGANVNQESARGTPLSTAASQGDTQTIGLLAQRGALLDHEMRDGTTALTVAVALNQAQAVRALLQRGADPQRENRDGVTALRLAEERALPEVHALLTQAAIQRGAEGAIAGAEASRAAGLAEVQERAAAARQQMESDLQASRADTADKVSSLKAESDEILQRLGLAGKPRSMPGARFAGLRADSSSAAAAPPSGAATAAQMPSAAGC